MSCNKIRVLKSIDSTRGKRERGRERERERERERKKERKTLDAKVLEKLDFLRSMYFIM